MSFADREPLRHRDPHGPYLMLGPVEVSDAEPGDVTRIVLRPVGSPMPLGCFTAAIDSALGSPALTGALWTARG
jgi:acetamidase/formamidase